MDKGQETVQEPKQRRRRELTPEAKQEVRQIYTDPSLLIPYTGSVKRKGGTNPKTQKPVDTSFVNAVKEKVKEENLVSNIWRWGRLKYARYFGSAAPMGWNPAQEINGFFNEYRDYLMEAENPEELELRKNYVISRINYERVINEIGWCKGTLSSVAGILLDPATYLLGGLGFKAGALAAKTAAKWGLGRIGTGVIRGAIEGEIIGLSETAIKRSLKGAQVVEPEYNVISNMLFGSVIGGMGGFLSEAAAYSKFRRQTRSNNFDLYQVADLEKRKLELGVYGELTSEQRLNRRAFVDEQIKKYIKGELESDTYHTFDISEAVDKKKEIAKRLGMWDATIKGSTKAAANAMDWFHARFSNQFNLLGCELETLREAGNRIFATSTFEEDILNKIGDMEPLTVKVARKNGVVFSKIENGLNEGYKIARENGFDGKRANFEEKVLKFMYDPVAREMETNPGVRQAVEAINGGFREAADWLYSVHGFEWQIERDARFEADVANLQKLGKKRKISLESIKKPLKGTEDPKSSSTILRKEYARLKADYDADMTGGLDKALKSFGGSYSPIYLDGAKIQLDVKGARKAIKESMLAGESEYYKRRMAEKITQCVDNVVKSEKPLTWVNLEAELKNFGLNGIFKNTFKGETLPDIDLIRMAERQELPFSKKFYQWIDKEVERRIGHAIDGEHQLISGFEKGIDIRNVLKRSLEAPEKSPRGSAHMRAYHDKPEYLEGFLKNDLHKTIEQYVKSMHSSAGMIEHFGDENATRFMDKVGADYVARCKKIEESALSTEEKRKALENLESSTKSGLKALRTALNHVKGYGSIDWGDLGSDSLLARGANIISNWNVARYLSDSIFSQFQDQANVALHLNGWSTFGESLTNFTKLLYNVEYRQELKHLVEDLGLASEYHMKGTRLREMVSVARETSSKLGKIEKVMEFAAEKAMKLSGTEFLDGWTRSNASYMTGSAIARAAEKILKGKELSSFEITFLNESKISSELLKAIGGQIEKHGELINGVRRLNLGDWEDKVAADNVRRVLYEHGVGATMIPGAELPALFKTPIGKILFQFHAFATATFSKMFMYSLECDSHKAATTIAQCLILDTFGKVCKSFGKWYGNTGIDPVTGKKRAFDAFDVTLRAMEESIQTNDWMTWAALDPAGIVQAIKNPRSGYGQFGGATAGLVRDVGRGGIALFEILSGGSASEEDKRALRRLIPFQNWFGIRLGIEGLKGFMER